VWSHEYLFRICIGSTFMNFTVLFHGINMSWKMTVPALFFWRRRIGANTFWSKLYLALPCVFYDMLGFEALSTENSIVHISAVQLVVLLNYCIFVLYYSMTRYVFICVWSSLKFSCESYVYIILRYKKYVRVFCFSQIHPSLFSFLYLLTIVSNCAYIS